MKLGTGIGVLAHAGGVEGEVVGSVGEHPADPKQVEMIGFIRDIHIVARRRGRIGVFIIRIASVVRGCREGVDHL